jgi:hypothetical protein
MLEQGAIRLPLDAAQNVAASSSALLQRLAAVDGAESGRGGEGCGELGALEMAEQGRTIVVFRRKISADLREARRLRDQAERDGNAGDEGRQ